MKGDATIAAGLLPEMLFEASWEVCNKIGGIHTVLSTKARTLCNRYGEGLVFIGPDFGTSSTEFVADETLFSDWTAHVTAHEPLLRVRTGRWNIPGTPQVIRIDFQPFFPERDRLYYEMWEAFGLDSSAAYGDYDEACIFACAAAQTIVSFCRFYRLENRRTVAHFNEWTLGMGLLYVRKHLPSVATVFTTHATTVGRSIAGNGKPLYGYMDGYNGDQMSRELNVETKHSLEKQAAHRADAFTTVSDITAVECARLLERTPDVVTPNGFEPDFVPADDALVICRRQARQTLLRVAGKLCGASIDPEAFLVATSGRYEYRNKGIDVFIDAMSRLRHVEEVRREVVAFILTPAWAGEPRADLKAALDDDRLPASLPMQTPFLTHWLREMAGDCVMNAIFRAGFANRPEDRLKIIFVPCYADGRDGILNLPYYSLLSGMDATVFPSYYEPWGYTPLESIAFGIPTVTTGLAGFGAWAATAGQDEDVTEAVTVVRRTDDNPAEAADATVNALLALSRKTSSERERLRQACFRLAARAQWSRFIAHYDAAFAHAIKSKIRRQEDTAATQKR